MTEQEKRELCGNYTLLKNGVDTGEPATVGGWANREASVTPYSGNFYDVSWEAVKEAHENGRKLDRNKLSLYSRLWLGFGEWTGEVQP